jgi:hypothetical protein
VPKNKVIPFPRPGTVPAPITMSYSWTIIILESGCSTKPMTAASRPRLPGAQLESLRVQSRFMKLRRAAKLGERIDGWRVCWLGGWDKSKVFYKVQVDRVVRAGRSTKE